MSQNDSKQLMPQRGFIFLKKMRIIFKKQKMVKNHFKSLH